MTLKLNYLLLFALIAAAWPEANAQESERIFAPPGAAWVYGCPPHDIRFFVAKDTLIEDKTCAVIEVDETYGNPEEYLQNWPLYRRVITHSDSERVYMRHADSFFVWIDFTLEPGDTFRIPNVHHGIDTLPGAVTTFPYFQMVVSDYYTLSSEGREYETQQSSKDQSQFPEYEDARLIGEGTQFTKNIAVSHSLYPRSAEWYEGGYYDYTIMESLHINGIRKRVPYYEDFRDCTVSIKELEISGKLTQIYLSDGILKVIGNTAEEVEFSIYNVSGKKIYNANLTGNESFIDTSMYPRGLYVIRVFSANLVQFQKIIL